MHVRELGHVSLADALALTLLAADLEDECWPRAAGRWVGRFLVESPAITISEAVMAAAAVGGLAGPDRALARETLRQRRGTATRPWWRSSAWRR
jgi:hypothetical protein